MAGSSAGRRALIGAVERIKGCFRGRFDLARLTRWPAIGPTDVDPRALLLQPYLDVPLVGVATVVPPVGSEVIAPWAPDRGGRFRLDASAFTSPGHLLVTRPPARRRLRACGAAVDLAIAPGFASLTASGTAAWARTALRALCSLYGRMPFQRATVAVVPTPAMAMVSESPVLHGVSSRGGGLHLVAYVRADTPDQALRDASWPALVGEWVLVHELFHLSQPWVDDEWFSEGLATYYGERLRRRAGLLTAEGMWWQLLDGFHRGRQVGGSVPLADESTSMHERHTYRRVYWAGAAIALLADVGIRQAGGEGGLDARVVELARRRGSLPLEAAIATLDGGERGGHFRRVAEAALAERAFPDVLPLLEALGVRLVHPPGWTEAAADLSGVTVTLDDAAPLAAIRRQLERAD